jgi:hypothetical protein
MSMPPGKLPDGGVRFLVVLEDGDYGAGFCHVISFGSCL